MKQGRVDSEMLTSPDVFFKLVFAFQKSRVVLTAFELGVFTALADENKTSSDVAKALGTADRATDRLMNALVAIGLLKKARGRFSNSPLAAHFLVKGKPDYMAGLGHGVNLWDTWSTLTQAVRAGKSVMGREVWDRGEDWLTSFIAAMHARARQAAPGIVALLDLKNVSRVLDVGGGSGGYAMAFVRAKKGITATVFDLPNVLPLTKGYIEAADLVDSVDTSAGNFNADPLPNGYDLAFLSAVIHSNTCREDRDLIRKAADALNPGGQVVVQDFIMEKDRTRPAFGALFSLNMLVGTDGGDTYTEEEVRAWMGEAGLSKIKRIDTKYNTTLIIGRKAK